MRSCWKGDYVFGEAMNHLAIKSVFKGSLGDNLVTFSTDSFDFFKGLDEAGNLYFRARALVYNGELFGKVAKFYLHNGRHFVFLRQLTTAHSGVRFGEMLLTKKAGRRIHLKSILKKKQRKGFSKK